MALVLDSVLSVLELSFLSNKDSNHRATLSFVTSESNRIKPKTDENWKVSQKHQDNLENPQKIAKNQ